AGRAAEALQSYEQARQAILPLTSGQSPAAADLAALCSTHLAVGNLQRREQDLAAAITATRTALESAERACRVEPQTAGYRELVAVSQRRAARLLRANEQSEEAISFYRRAIATWSKLAFEQPALPGFKADLMRTWRELAAYQHALGRPDDAALTERRAAQYFRELPQSVGEDCFQVAVVCAQLAAAPAEDELAPTPEDEARRGADGQRAVEALGEAIKLGYQPPTDLASHPLLAHLSTREDFRRLAAAVRLPTTTGGTPTASGNAKAPSTPDLSLRLTILGSLRGIADAQRSLNQLEDSQATLEQCQQQLDELAQQHAQDNPAIVAERGHILYALGHVHWQAQRYLQAKQAWDEGYEVLQRAYAAASQTDRSQMGRAASRQEHELIHVYGRVGAWHEAGRHRARYIAFDRCADSESEALLTVLTRVADAGESYDDACRYMFDRFAREDPSYTAWALSFGEQPVLSPAQVVELAKQKLSDPGRSEWKRTVLGYCQLRTGHGADAVQNILELKDWNHHFVALAIHQIGDNEAARVWLDIGERAYTSSARNWLASASLDCRLLSQDLGQTWWEMLRVQVMRREAWQAIANESAVDPWAKLFEASGAAIVGDATGSETAFRAAVEMAAKDARVWVTRAETRAVLKQYEQAEQDFAKAIELEPANPEWWIARGKFYLERGLDAQADADYQRAAEFSPDDLDIFLRTGVWAVGPYPAAMNQSFPPEETPHPSRPVKKQDANGEVSNTSGRWNRIPLNYLDDNWGNVVLNSLTGNAANVSAYALAIVYSPRPRTASVMLSSGQHLRLWVNGACVYDDPTPTSNHEALERVPVSLQQGRNELLVRISTKDQNCSFMLRLGDAPIERAWVAAQLMQWDEAVAAFEKIPLQQLVRAGHHWFTYCRCLAAAENREHFETAVRLAYSWRRYRHHVAWQLVWLLRSGSMMPTGTLTRDEWLALVKDYGEPSYNWGKAAKLRSLYRAGEFAETVDYCNRQPDLVNPDDLFERLAVDPILAMAYHQLGQTAEANEQLQKANEQFRSRMAARVERPGVEAEIPWMMSPHGWALLTEANRLIRGVELKDDPTYQFLQQKIARELAAIRPELADHDLALLFQPNEPRLYLARAQRFADLSRWEEAEADFQKATSLKSDDPLNWLAIGQYWLSRQNLAKAGESYARAVELDHTQAWTHVLNKVLTGNDALLAAALATQPQNAELWTLRGQQMCEAGRWAKAAEAWQKRIA
ncbi:MAG: hypothetical protein MUF48_24055, partial [Pirellulaceae bacterium]|nr:hypothetical protein [Pirellulaceae bacterium]